MTQFEPGTVKSVPKEVYSILAFGGFEGAAPLAEEARDPRRTVPRAVLLATLGIGLAYNPTNAFALIGTGIVTVIVAVYIVANAACIGYFASSANRGPGRRWNPLLHLIIPLAGIAAFVPAWPTAAGIRVFSFVAPPTPRRRTWGRAWPGSWSPA
jgi:amino acid transporter